MKFYKHSYSPILNLGYQLFSGVKRMCKHFLIKIFPTASSLELLGRATVVAITHHQGERWCDWE
jgi:hypothetical protein